MTFANKNVRAIFLIASALSGIGLLSSCSDSGGEQAGGFPPPMVSVADVLVERMTPWQEFSGRITAKEAVQVRPRIGGVIEQVHYQEGSLVNEGDLLFTIDQKPFKAELQRASAELERARAQLKLAKLEGKRASDLFKKKLLSQDEHDRRKAAEQQAEANMQAAEASYQLAKLNLEYTEVRSPITGRTGLAQKTRGNLVSSTPSPDLLTSVLSLDPVYVEFESDENTYLAFFDSADVANQVRKVFVALGQNSEFTLEGQLEFVDNQINQQTGTIRMRAVLPNQDLKLTPGMFARIKLLASQPKTMMLVSESAILTDQDRKYVYVLGKDNQAVRKDVTTDRAFKQFRIIRKGLENGDKVIVHGLQKIFFPNMPVNPTTITMGDPPAVPQQDQGPASAH